MAGFDNPGLYYHDRFVENGDGGDELNEKDLQVAIRAAHKRFKEFLRTFHKGGFTHIYRDQLRRHCNLGEFWLEVKFSDLHQFDEELAEQLKHRPTLFHPIFEEAAKEVGDEITKPRPEGEEIMPEVQVILSSSDNCQSIRSIKSSQVSKLVTVSGIVIAASQVRSKATHITIMCRSCHHTRANIALRPGLDGFPMPRTCSSDQASLAQKCPIDPYFIVPDKCKCVDFQVLKLQETPDDVPHGEMPRHLQLYATRYLTDKLAPGSKVTVFGVYSIKKVNKQKGDRDRVNVGIRAPYLRVLGMNVESEGLRSGATLSGAFSPEEEEQFRNFARQPDIYEKIAKSVAPSIFGSEDIKKSIACLLFGGSRKRLPDGLNRRGDINVLLLGDPGTAKSQLLKFVEKVAPIGIYTSGKGSSAAGLTASVIRDPASRSFVMEGGAMVLADGGVVCIDEFDKMREDDRVAIHEAMEQQTISIAKAGITTTLNSRCSVLAAANSVYGRWDDTKGEENIDFMPTILSRFDMIYIVKDQHDERRDVTLAKHVIGVHMGAGGDEPDQVEGELPLEVLRKYVSYCRKTCGPRLTESAGAKLVNNYVRLRNGHDAGQSDLNTAFKKSPIPITVRQLEAIVRISESLAKMELNPFASEKHVDEALRLFQVSTLEAAATGKLAGVEGFTTIEEQELMNRIETQLKRRFAVGTQVSEHVILQDFLRQRYPEHAVHKVLQVLIRRGDVQHRLQRKMLYRVK